MATVTDHPAQERYELAVDGEPAGYLAYRRRSRLIALIHTEIDPRFEGQGLGGELARFALDAARADGLQVLPFCPFVNAYLGRHPEYVDLVPESQRANFDLL